MLIGVDDEVSRDHCTSFEVTCHATIAHAIGAGIRRLYVGRGLEIVKQRRGCSFIDSWVYHLYRFHWGVEKTRARYRT